MPIVRTWRVTEASQTMPLGLVPSEMPADRPKGREGSNAPLSALRPDRTASIRLDHSAAGIAVAPTATANLRLQHE